VCAMKEVRASREVPSSGNDRNAVLCFMGGWPRDFVFQEGDQGNQAATIECIVFGRSSKSMRRI